MVAVAVAVVILMLMILIGVVSILRAGSGPEPRGSSDEGPDGAGVREPRSPRPSAGAASVAVEPPGDNEAA